MITYEAAVLAGIIILLIYGIISLLIKREHKRIIISCIFIAYVTVVAAITLFPILIDEKVEYFGDITWYNFIPFRTIMSTLQDGFSITGAVQILGNIFMSIPFGYFVMMFLNKPKWWKMLLLALMFPLIIELLQMFIGFTINNMYRTVDIDDIVLNVAGTYLGYAVYKILPSNFKQI